MNLAESARALALHALGIELENGTTEQVRHVLDELADAEIRELGVTACKLGWLCNDIIYERVYGEALRQAAE
jgi:hypothetical protein